MSHLPRSKRKWVNLHFVPLWLGANTRSVSFFFVLGTHHITDRRENRRSPDFQLWGDSNFFSRKNVKFKRLYFMARNGWVSIRRIRRERVFFLRPKKPLKIKWAYPWLPKWKCLDYQWVVRMERAGMSMSNSKFVIFNFPLILRVRIASLDKNSSLTWVAKRSADNSSQNWDDLLFGMFFVGGRGLNVIQFDHSCCKRCYWFILGLD